MGAFEGLESAREQHLETVTYLAPWPFCGPLERKNAVIDTWVDHDHASGVHPGMVDEFAFFDRCVSCQRAGVETDVGFSLDPVWRFPSRLWRVFSRIKGMHRMHHWRSKA